MDPAVVLHTPIADLPVSLKFYRQSKKMGFVTLSEIVPLGVCGLVDRPHFSYRWLGELLVLLRNYRLEHLLQQ